jgi:hypothetical protein
MAAASVPGPHFFASGAAFRAWLERHHARATGPDERVDSIHRDFA